MKDLMHLERYRINTWNDFGTLGDAHNGAFKVFVKGRSFLVIASNGGGWDHVSVTPGGNKRKCPTWEEMCAIKDMFFEPEEAVMQLHPKRSQHINIHPYCLHLWRPQVQAIPELPLVMV